MMMSDSPQSTAWAPWRGGREWLLRRDILACAWLRDRAKEEGGTVVVQGAFHAPACRWATRAVGVCPHPVVNVLCQFIDGNWWPDHGGRWCRDRTSAPSPTATLQPLR